MSKEKATRVIVHRIEFQQKERELIEGLALAYSINKIATPTVALMSDVSGMIVLAGMLGVIGIAIDVSGLNSESAMAEVITARLQEEIVLQKDQLNTLSETVISLNEQLAQLRGN
jgi:cell division protein FtsB